MHKVTGTLIYTSWMFFCFVFFFNSLGIKHKTRPDGVVNIFFRLLIGLFCFSLEYLWCIPTASYCSCDQWWIQLRIFGIMSLFKCTVAEQSTRWSGNHRLGQPTKQTFSSLWSRPNSEEQDRYRKKNVVECSYRACVQRNEPSQVHRKVHIFPMTFLYMTLDLY